MKPHPDHERHVLDQSEDLAGAIFSFENVGSLRVGHLRDNGVRMLRIFVLSQFHRNENNLRVEAFGHVIGGIGKNGVVLLDVEIRRRRSRLAHGEPDERRVRVDAFLFEHLLCKGLWFE